MISTAPISIGSEMTIPSAPPCRTALTASVMPSGPFCCGRDAKRVAEAPCRSLGRDERGDGPVKCTAKRHEADVPSPPRVQRTRRRFGRYPSSAAAARTRRRTSSLTRGSLFITRETVFWDTPARRATSVAATRRLAAPARLLNRSLRSSDCVVMTTQSITAGHVMSRHRRQFDRQCRPPSCGWHSRSLSGLPRSTVPAVASPSRTSSRRSSRGSPRTRRST